VTLARVLVVRSGTRPFGPAGPGVEVVERVSHAVAAVVPAPELFARPADLTIFTSRTAVDCLGGVWIPGGEIAAVGPATAEALRARGALPTLVAGGSVASLLDRLPAGLTGRAVLWPCGEDAGTELEEGLRARGAELRRVTVYRKVANSADPALEEEISDRPFAAFCATSPSAARWLFDQLSEGPRAILRDTPAVALGPATLRALRAAGVEAIAVTGEASFPATAQILAWMAERQPHLASVPPPQ
jgi:uroporphyrinogen-III synthase